MNSTLSRLKAVAVTAMAFAVGAFCTLGIVWLLGAFLPDAVGAREFGAYSPHSSIAALSDLRAIMALSAIFSVLTGLVLIIDSQYCDRMIAVLADVLLMVMAAIAGFVAGYWILLRLAGYSNFLDVGFLRTAIIAPVVVFVVSLLPLAKVRAVIPARIALVSILLLGGPVLLVLTD
ncbi:hypothetical protein [Pelagibacterium limicola]|uniref:hypothetical protein n=1 Tax=Pelagibacterium limicola TaxID=2791022 RepID=UPI0018AF9AFA|nr:hypothetical protein [Pelagibacterium limicola]